MKALIRYFVFLLALSLSMVGQSATTSANTGIYPLYVKAQLGKAVKLTSLKPGDVTEGKLTRDVYSADRMLFPAGSRIRLTVDHLERKRRTSSDRWPWVIKLFLPRHETYPSFRDAAISRPDGSDELLRVSLISASPKTEIHAQPTKHPKKPGPIASAAPAARSDMVFHDSHSSSADASTLSGPVMSLEAYEDGNGSIARDPGPAPGSHVSAVVLPAGTVCRILLLDNITASKSHPGDAVRARLLEPVEVDSHIVLPAGSIFDGTVLKAIPPRWLSRAGSVALTFSGLVLPGGNRIPVSASLTAVELNRGSHTKIDAEGHLHGDRPGVAWMLINGGATAGLAKEVDDATQLMLEAILSGATDASTAGTARIGGTIVSSIFMLTRHGHDVVLPIHTEMNIVLNRPLVLSSQVPATIPTQ